MKVIFIIFLLLTIFGSVNSGFIPSNNDLVERWVPKRFVNYTYYVFAFSGIVTLILYSRMSMKETKQEDHLKD